MKLLAFLHVAVGYVAAFASLGNAAGDAPLLSARIEELPERELHMYAARAANMKREAPSFATYGDAVSFVNNLRQNPGSDDGLTQPWGTTRKCVGAPHPSTCATCAIATNIVFVNWTIGCGFKYAAENTTPLLKGSNIAACILTGSGVWYPALIGCLGV